ncbi:MAG: hypothetical protein JKY61_08770 [Planctomycetes bacterium]|nr:hypothetical protein [Planctomycetota bacterium]
MRYLFITLPCLFACAPSDQGAQQASITAEPSISRVLTTTPAGQSSGLGEAMSQALADQLGDSIQAAFDEQAAIYAQGGTKEQIALARTHFDATKALSESELEACFVIQEENNGRSALDILEHITGEAGFTLDATSFKGELAAVPETQILGLSKIEALERISAEMGLVPVYPGPFAMGPEEFTIGFTTDARKTPAAFAGPFLILVSELEEQAPHAVGSVHLTARAIGMPEAAFLANDTMFETFAVSAVESNMGEDLRSREDVRRLSTPQCKGGMVTMSTEIDLKGLLASTTSIDSLSGTIHLNRPAQVLHVSFDEMKPSKQTIDGLDIMLKEIGTNTSMKIRLEQDEELTVAWAPDKANGDPLGILSSSSYGYNKEIDATLNTPEIPSQLSAKLISTEKLEIPFEINNIAFLNSSAQPQALATLEFDHAQPVSVVFVEFKDRESQFPEVLLRTVSHANKDARTLHIKMIYLDDKNKEIKNSFTSLNPAPTFNSQTPLAFVQSGAIETTTQTAFFMPKETVSVQISVREVEFMDGTSWKADE